VRFFNIITSAMHNLQQFWGFSMPAKYRSSDWFSKSTKSAVSHVITNVQCPFSLFCVTCVRVHAQKRWL